MSSGGKDGSTAEATVPASPEAAAPKRASELGWLRVLDDQTGSEYFWNSVSGETSWTLPEGLVPPATRRRYNQEGWGSEEAADAVGNLHSASTHTRSGSVQSAESAVDGLRTAQSDSGSEVDAGNGGDECEKDQGPGTADPAASVSKKSNGAGSDEESGHEDSTYSTASAATDAVGADLPENEKKDAVQVNGKSKRLVSSESLHIPTEESPPPRSSTSAKARKSQSLFTDETERHSSVESGIFLTGPSQRDRASSRLRKLANCKGWLGKKTHSGFLHRNYRQRWFVLHLSVLEYWTKEQKTGKSGKRGGKKQSNDMDQNPSKRFFITPNCVITSPVPGEPEWTIELSYEQHNDSAKVATAGASTTSGRSPSDSALSASSSSSTSFSTSSDGVGASTNAPTNSIKLQCKTDRDYKRWLRALRQAHAEICEVNGDRIKLAGLAFKKRNNTSKMMKNTSSMGRDAESSRKSESVSMPRDDDSQPATASPKGARPPPPPAPQAPPGSMTLEEILVGALLDSLLSITKGKRRASVFAMDRKVQMRRSRISTHGSSANLLKESTLSKDSSAGGTSTRIGIIDQEDEIWYDDLHRTPFGAQVFAPGAFARIRRSHGCSDVDYRTSIMQGFTGKAAEGDGKSGQLFLMTKDKRLVMKTLKGYEMVFFEKILPQYCQHLDTYPGSLLCRFYDVVTLTEPGSNAKISIIVMPNLFYGAAKHFPKKGSLEMFDLKGSVRNRNVTQEEIDCGVSTLKDLNFNRRCSVLGTGIMLPDHLRGKFFAQLDVDSALLRELDIMDYSLLLGIATESLEHATPGGSGEGGVNPDALSRNGFTSRLGQNPLHALKVNTWSSYKGGIRSAPLAQTGRRAKQIEIYYLSVIDILQEFDFSKRMENRYKSLTRNENLISAVSSARYANRFVSYIANRSGPQIEREKPWQLSRMCLDHLADALIQCARAERMRAGRGVHLSDDDDAIWDDVSWEKEHQTKGGNFDSYSSLREHKSKACRPTYFRLLISDQYKSSHRFRNGEFYSITDAAAPVFRTLRHLWGYDDDTYIRLLESGFERSSSYRGPGQRETHFYGGGSEMGEMGGWWGDQECGAESERGAPLSENSGSETKGGSIDAKLDSKKTDGAGMAFEEVGKGGLKRAGFDETTSFRCYTRGVPVRSTSSFPVDADGRSDDTSDRRVHTRHELRRSRQLLVKAISEASFDNILSSLPNYCNHMGNHPQSSLLVRILGVYKIAFVRGGDEEASPDDIKDCYCVVIENALLPVAFKTTLTRNVGPASSPSASLGRGSDVTSRTSCSSLELLRTYSLKGSKGRHRTIKRTGIPKAGNGGVKSARAKSHSSSHSTSSSTVEHSRTSSNSSSQAASQRKMAQASALLPGVAAATIAGLSPLHLMDLDYDAGTDQPIWLSKQDADRVLKMLKRDFEFLKSIGAMNYSVHLGIYKKGGDRTKGVLASKSTEVRGSNKSSGSHAKNAVDVGTDEEVIQEQERCLHRHNCFAGSVGPTQNGKNFVFTFGIHKTDARWEGSKRVGGTLASILSSQAKKSNINPRNYAARLLDCMSQIVKAENDED